MTDTLPIDAALPALIAALGATRQAVLQAPPGAGKTTRVPLALLFAPGEAGRWRVEGEAPVAEVRLSGPEVVVRALKAEDLTAWIDLHQGPLTAGEHELAVLIQAPEAVQAEAGRIRVRLAAVQ